LVLPALRIAFRGSSIGAGSLRSIRSIRGHGWRDQMVTRHRAGVQL